MLLTGDYFRVQINFQPFWEKPPLFFWLQVVSMRAFGVNEFAARLPNAMCGIITLNVLYAIGRKVHSEKFGRLWTLIYLGSFLPHFYFKSGIIDPVFNLFIFCGIYFLFSALQLTRSRTRFWKFVIAGIFIGFGILTKGPVAYLVATLSLFIYTALRSFDLSAIGAMRRGERIRVLEFLGYTVAAGLISLLWFGAETAKNGVWFLKEFLLYQIGLFSQPVAGHGQPWFYHIVVLFFGVFPASILAFRGIRQVESDTQSQQDFKLWMLVFFAVVLTIFSISTTKIVHYSSLCYFSITYFAARFALQLIDGQSKWTWPVATVIGIVGAVMALLIAALPLALTNKELILPYVKDQLTLEVLKANVSWSGYEFLTGVFYLAAIVAVLILFSQQRFTAGVITLFISTAICLQLFMLTVAPRVAAYTQGANVRFYKSLQGEHCYVEVLGFKSYAHLFYLQKPPVTNLKSYDERWLLEGKIDKPAYFVGKIIHADEWRKYPQLRELKSENGFVYFKRDVPDSSTH
ncbi:MAG: glycosyltransferase family 39 protein [Rhizobacter sp.]|nr:glycosyltransferase family 39 protein [Chlorobiales bacterium]